MTTIDLLNGPHLIPIIDYRGKTLEERVALLEARLDALVYRQYAHREIRFDSKPTSKQQWDSNHSEMDRWMGDNHESEC